MNRYNNSNTIDNETGLEMCPIMLTSYLCVGSDYYRAIIEPCGHHMSKMAFFAIRDNKCPICRMELNRELTLRNTGDSTNIGYYYFNKRIYDDTTRYNINKNSQGDIEKYKELKSEELKKQKKIYETLYYGSIDDISKFIENKNVNIGLFRLIIQNRLSNIRLKRSQISYASLMDYIPDLRVYDMLRHPDYTIYIYLTPFMFILAKYIGFNFSDDSSMEKKNPVHNFNTNPIDEYYHLFKKHGMNSNYHRLSNFSLIDLIIISSRSHYNIGSSYKNITTDNYKIDKLKTVAKYGIDINQTNQFGLTSFILAIYFNSSIKVLNTLLELGVDLSKQNLITDFYGLDQLGIVYKCSGEDNIKINKYINDDSIYDDYMKESILAGKSIIEFAKIINSPRLSYLEKIYSEYDKKKNEYKDDIKKHNREIICATYEGNFKNSLCVISGGRKKKRHISKRKKKQRRLTKISRKNKKNSKKTKKH